MNFGEKLYKLRKEKGWSQETLAEKVDTTRQAISKWENNAGYPETEKLLMLSNVFEVSIDYLLKEQKEERGKDDAGYYVSKEMAQGYLANTRKINRYIGVSSFCWLLSGSCYALFRDDEMMRIASIALCIALGIASIVIGSMKENDDYKILKQEPLLFDQEVLKELSRQYHLKEKWYQYLIAACVIVFVFCLIPVFLSAKGVIVWRDFSMFSFLGMAMSSYGFIQSVGFIEMYELFIKNEQYHKQLWVKVMKKIKNKLS